MTREDWEKVLLVMRGDVPDVGISLRSACAWAGVEVSDVRALIKASRSGDPKYEDWVRLVAEQYDGIDEFKADTLEGVLFDRAVNGVDVPVYGKDGDVIGHKKKHDNILGVRLLTKYNPKFKEQKGVSVDGKVDFVLNDVQDIRSRLVAQKKMAINELKYKDSETVFDQNYIEGEIDDGEENE